jgi:hypothetical protein
LRLPTGMGPRGRLRVEEMCGHIQRGPFADLRLGRRGEHHINFEVLKPMGKLRDQMKRTARFVVCNRGMVKDRELTIQVRGKNSVDCSTMPMICRPVVMVGLGMDMNQRRGEHPYGCPKKDQQARARWCVTYPSH